MKLLVHVMVNRWRNMMIPLVCNEDEQMEEYDDTAFVLRVNRLRNVIFLLVRTVSEQMECDDAACVY